MKKKPSPFTHVGSIYKSKGKFGGDVGYSQYVINKELSKNGELVDFVNLVQQYTLSNGLHFKVMQSLFPYSSRPGFKQFPWIWKGSQKVNKEVEVIAKHYEESLDNAEKYYEILKSSPKGKEKLKWLKRVYGLENK